MELKGLKEVQEVKEYKVL
jgi:hypothetical protein